MVDRRVSLQEILAPGGVEANAPCGADDPLSDGLPQVIGVANRQHHIANMRRAFRVDRDHRQPAGGVDLQHGEVGQGIGAYQQRFEDPAVLQRDDNLVGIVNHMLVGQDIAALVHDHPGAKRQLIMAGAVQGAVIDVHYGGRRAAYGGVIARRGVVCRIVLSGRRQLPLAQRRHQGQQQAPDKQTDEY